MTADGEFSGPVATFTDSNPSAGTITATIDWGNGDTETGTITQSGSTFTVSGDEIYSISGNVAPIVTVSDSGGSAEMATAPLTINASGSATGDEGQDYTLQLAPAGPNTSAISSWSINWGDGDTQTVTGNPSTVDHTFVGGTSSANVVATAYDGLTLLQTAAAVAVAITPAAPTNFQAAWAGGSTVDLTWTNNSSIATGIEIEQSTDGGNTFTSLATVSSGATSYTVTGASAASGAIYAMVATNSGSGAASTQPTADPGPAAPTLSGEVVSSTEIDLTYSDPSGVPLELEELGPNDLNFALTSATLATTSGSHTYAVTGLSADSAYSFRIRAVRNGLVAYSPELDINTDMADGGADAPEITSVDPVTGTDPFLYGVTFTDGGFSVANWASLLLSVQTANDPRHYFYNSASDNWWQSMVGTNTGETGVIYNGGDSFTAYFDIMAVGEGVTIQLFDGSAGPSTPDPLTAGDLHPTTPALPPTLSLTGGAVTSGVMNLTWSGQNANMDGFTIFERQGTTITDVKDVSSDSGDTSENVTIAGSDCKFFAVANYSSLYPGLPLWGGYSNIVDGASSSAPTAPTGLTATVVIDNLATSLSDNHVRLVWDNVPDDESGYYVERSSDGGFTWTKVSGPSNLPADKTSFVDTGMQPGTYSYRVTAFDPLGSATSSATAVTVQPPGYLVALDGNTDSRSSHTNIYKFFQQYSRNHPDTAHYYHGTGVEYAAGDTAQQHPILNLGNVAFGLDATSIMAGAYMDLARYYTDNPGAQATVPVDIVGYSRGAMEAVALANLVARYGVPNLKTEVTTYRTNHGQRVPIYNYTYIKGLTIRFVGLLTPVYQVGFSPFISLITLGHVNPSSGWPTSLPSGIAYSDQAKDDDPFNPILPEMNIGNVSLTEIFLGDDHHEIGQDPNVLTRLLMDGLSVDVPV